MDETEILDETLMQYADGTLDDAGMRRVEEVAERNPEVARRIALFSGTGAALADLARARKAEPVSPDLEARAREMLAASRNDATVVSFAPRSPARERWAFTGPAAIAASLALAVGLTAGWLIAEDGAGGTLDGIALAGAEGVRTALTRLEAGSSAEIGVGELTLVSSFRDGAGVFCREYEIARKDTGLVAVACFEDGAWFPRFAAATGSPAGGYEPASSLDTLDAFLVGIGAGAPLDADAEAEALATLSR